MHNNLEENLIIEEIQKGNTTEFGKIYDHYIKKIYRFVYYKTHHKENAEDITSKVFIKAFENIRKFNPKKGNFQGWIYKIARNSVIDFYRSQKLEENIDDAWDLETGEDVEGDTEIRIKIKEIKEYLKDLSPIQRDIIIMRVWQELSYKEIAEAIGKNEANCKMIYVRGVKKLKDVMPLALFLFLIK